MVCPHGFEEKKIICSFKYNIHLVSFLFVKGSIPIIFLDWVYDGRVRLRLPLAFRNVLNILFLNKKVLILHYFSYLSDDLWYEACRRALWGQVRVSGRTIKF